MVIMSPGSPFNGYEQALTEVFAPISHYGKSNEEDICRAQTAKDSPAVGPVAFLLGRTINPD